MESLPLKGLDFGLQKRTGPSSGVVASIVLVSKGLDCPGMSLVEVCATCLRCHLWFKVKFGKSTYITCKPQPQNHKELYHLKDNLILYVNI